MTHQKYTILNEKSDKTREKGNFERKVKNNNIYLPKKQRKDMTYILGARCSDGVVLVADTKVTIDEGADYAYSKKLTNPLTTIVMGAAGIGGLYKDFQNRIISTIVQAERDAKEEGSKFEITEEEFGVLVNKIIREMHKDYDEDRSLLLNNLMILCASRIGNDATLTTFNPFGFPEPVNKYRVIGHGEPYGELFMKKLWDKNMTMEETSKLGIFIIKFIQHMKLDNSVGCDSEFPPQVYYIPDLIVPQELNTKDKKAIEDLFEKYRIKELNEEETEYIINQISSKISDFDDIFKQGKFKI